jgi:hypothetical protein
MHFFDLVQDFPLWQQSLHWSPLLVQLFLVLNEMASHAVLAMALQITVSLLSRDSVQLQLLADVYQFEKIADSIAPVKLILAIGQGLINLIWVVRKQGLRLLLRLFIPAVKR